MLACAPSQIKHYKENGSCFSLNTLQKLAAAYNRHYSDKIENIDSLSYQSLKDILNKKLEPLCKTDSCRAEVIGLGNDPAINQELRPKTPKTWLKNPVTWLTNFNIEAVMIQYESLYTDFKFLGVYPVDFAFENTQKTCLYSEMCDIDFKDLEKSYKYIGFIINLDKHTGPGTHWTSIFIDFIPSSKWYGMYYYDSTGKGAPTEIKEFYKMIKSKLTRSFKLTVNTTRHQRGNTECGVFSMYFIIKWLSSIHRQPEKTTFEEIIKQDAINDRNIMKLRKVFFRPIQEFKNTT